MIQFPIKKKIHSKVRNNGLSMFELLENAKRNDHLGKKPKLVEGKVFKLEGLEDFPEEPIPGDEPQENTPDDSFRDAKWGGYIQKPLMSPFGRMIGCPLVTGTVQIFSVWPGGFNGQAYFSRATTPLYGGWVAMVKFSMPVVRLDPFNTIPHSSSRSGYEYLLLPKAYAANLYLDQVCILFVHFTVLIIHWRSRVYLNYLLLCNS